MSGETQLRIFGCCTDRACTSETCMSLPPGMTCGDCVHIARCKAIYGHAAADTYCDWFPRRFLLSAASFAAVSIWRKDAEAPTAAKEASR